MGNKFDLNQITEEISSEISDWNKVPKNPHLQND